MAYAIVFLLLLMLLSTYTTSTVYFYITTAVGKVFSIVQTARANGLNVEEYIKYVIENISTKNIDDILPWSNKLPGNIKII